MKEGIIRGIILLIMIGALAFAAWHEGYKYGTWKTATGVCSRLNLTPYVWDIDREIHCGGPYDIIEIYKKEVPEDFDWAYGYGEKGVVPLNFSAEPQPNNAPLE